MIKNKKNDNGKEYQCLYEHISFFKKETLHLYIVTDTFCHDTHN